MIRPLDHERCSELLGAYAAGKLTAPEAEEVEAHLRSCAECSAERRAVLALHDLAGRELARDRLDDLERHRLHEALAGLAPAVPAARRSRRARLAPALGAAAVAALVVAGALFSGGDDTATEAGSTLGDRRQLIGPPTGAPELEAGADAAGAGSARDSDAPSGKPPRPEFGTGAALTASTVQEVGRKGEPFVEFAAFYTVADVADLQRFFTRELADQAPGEDLARQVTRCIGAVTAALPYAVLPAFAAEARIDGQHALVVGFAWSERPIGALDQYMMWAWPRGGCDGVPLLYEYGRIKR